MVGISKLNQRDKLPTEVSFGDGANVDPFHRLRVSSPFTVLDLKQNNDNLPLYIWDAQTSGSGTTSTYNTNQASTTIAVASSTAGTRVRQSKMWGIYQPGKGELVLCSFVFGTGVTGVTKRVGYFWDLWGLYLQQSGSTVSVVRRTYNTGSVVNTVVNQSDWNIDKMDGSGVSGITLDFTKTQILIIDFEWLGVGSVRYGFVVDGDVFYCHIMKHANNLTQVYMSNPNAPIRYEISSDGTGGAASLVHICSTVMSEGGQETTALTNYISRDGTPLTMAAQDLFAPILSIKLKPDRRCTRVRPLDISIICTTNTNYEWAVFLNPTIASTDLASYASIPNSALLFDLARTAGNLLTGGFKITGGYGASAAAIKLPSQGAVESFLTLGSYLTSAIASGVGGTASAGDYAYDELVIGIKNIDANGGTCYGGIVVSEYC